MAYLAGVKKEDLRSLCEDLGLTVTSKMSIIAIRDLIINDTNYDEEFTREHLKSIIQNRKSDYEQRMKEIESERAFEWKNYGYLSHSNRQLLMGWVWRNLLLRSKSYFRNSNHKRMTFSS
ncbi:hypothetical protein AVEN_198875-1 [Araneus ventricosus]|uniref:Uncharacterized protein n=1 Tax=Araneus ventricosus TaxID=182803 RepID=A0A4Y2SXY2_ARAVE|nr:hypothetical protein AVEN_198875-1 [Araneus ventricosus]